MTKKEVQQRVLQNGKPLALDKFTWCEETRTFSTLESDLVLGFKNVDCLNFNTGDNCNFITDGFCTFNTGSNCTFKTDSNCNFETGSDCNFDTWSYCIFNTWSNCTFNTGDNCTFNTGDNCTFDTGSNCTFDIFYNGKFFNECKNNVVIIRYSDLKQIYDLDLLEKDKLIRLNINNEPLFK